MIACRTIIGYGAPNKQGSESTHGSPLGAEEIAATRESLGWTSEPFVVPEAILSAWRATGVKRQAEHGKWSGRLKSLPADARSAFERAMAGELPDGWESALLELKRQTSEEAPKIATREASKEALNALAPVVPNLVGGSADLTGSNLTQADGMLPVTRDDFGGRYIYYGVREHGMAAIMNGLALHRGVVPYGGTVPGLRRLLPAVDPPVRANGPTRHLCHDARFDRAWRRRPDPPARGTPSRACALFQT